MAEAARRGRIDYLERFTNGRDRWSRPGFVPMGDEELPAAADGYSPMIEAIRFDRPEVVRFLCPYVKLDELTWTGRSLLELARALGRAEIATILEEAGAKPADPSTFTAFQLAAYGLLERLRPALDDPANARFFGSYLASAAQAGHVDVIHEVASRGADDKAVSGALGYAAQRGHLGALRALLSWGANPNATSVYPSVEGRELRRLLVQIVGQRLVPADFGDAGHAYVFADEDDPTRVALVTQAY